MPPVTNLFETSAKALSLALGFIRSLFSAVSIHGYVGGPQLNPFIPPSCASNDLSDH